MRPFLKWPGGKRWLIARYRNVFPDNYRAYFEPFLGGGSVFFYLMPQQATISDINSELINVYHVMAKSPARLRELLENHQENHDTQHYYAVRAAIPDGTLERAARFLYLNRTCFNGMYRVNERGQFNVPIGSKIDFIDDIELFEEYSRVLRHAHIRTQDFVDTLRGAADRDFIFADPPYAISQNQNSFLQYNGRLFSWRDQKRLFNALVRARERGAIIVSTNAQFPALREMYEQAQFFVQTVHRFSSISGQSKGRGQQEELLISSRPIN